MNYLSREKAKALIEELELPLFFLKVLDDQLEHPTDIYFTCPVLFFLNKQEQEAYELGDIIPLWADTGGYMHYAYDILRKDYVTFDIEDGLIVKRYSWEELSEEIMDFVLEQEYDEHGNIECAIESARNQLESLSIANFDILAQKFKNDFENS